MNSSAELQDSKIKHYIPMPSLWHWICGIIIILVSFAHFFSGQMSFYAVMPRHVFVYGLITPFALALAQRYNKTAKTSLKILAGIIALLFSQFITIGGSFFQVHNWSLCFGNVISIVIWLLQTLCYGFVLYKIILGAYAWIQKYNVTRENTSVDILKWIIAIVVVRLIFLAAFYPCVFGFDASVGLRTFVDPDCATCSHHPILIEWIHAIFYNLGKSIGHISVGFAILSFLFIIASTAIIVYGLKLLELSHISKRWIFGIAAVYAFFPIFPYLSVNPTKDGFFAYAFLFYIFTLYELYLTNGLCFKNTRYLILHAIAIILVCLTRNQGLYLVVLECIFLLFCYRNYWHKILIVAIPSLFLVSLYNNLLLPYCNVEEGGKQEVHGTLFQQTTYYLKQHPKDVTQEELSAINAILNKDTIVNKYVFDKTDAVKNDYKYNPWYRATRTSPSMFRHVDRTNESKDLKAYKSAWLSMGLRHPLCYMEAAIGPVFGFFYNYNKLILETEPKWAQNGLATTPEYRFVHVNTIARIYNNNIYRLFKIPVLNWIIAIPYYNWAAIFLLALLFYRKDRRGLSIFLPVLLSLGILLICPMVYGRYAYPIIMGLPLLIVYVFSSREAKRLQ